MEEEKFEKSKERIDSMPENRQQYSGHEKGRKLYYGNYGDGYQRTGWIIIVLIIVLLAGVGSFMLGRETTLFRGSKINNGIMRNEDERGMMGRSYGDGGMMEGRGMMGGYGRENTRISGEVTAINGNQITIKDNDSNQYTVNISDTTSYRNNAGIAKASDLKVNNSVLVIGSSNSSGEINATLIEIR